MQLFKLISLFSILALLQINAQIKSADYEVFTSEDIRIAGLVNLNDLTDLSIYLDKSSINGYSGRIAVSGLSTFQNQNILVLVNGQKIDLSFLGEFNLDVLPFNIDQIDTVIIVNRNTNYKGYSTDNGLIELIINSQDKGFSLKAFQSIGNEVGDPGPYAYTEYQSPNVDKLGFLAGLSLKSSGDNWNIISNLKFNENFVTDHAISPRLKSLSKISKARILGVNTILAYNFLRGSHQLIFNFSENEDLVYFHLFGNEIPNKRVHRHVGFNGTFPLNKKLKINYVIANGINEYAEVENNLDLNFNLKINSTLIATSLEYTNARMNGKVGLEYQKYDGNRSGLSNDEEMEFLRTHFDVGFNVFTNIKQFAGLQLTKNQGRSSANGYLKTDWNIDRKNFLQLNVSYSQKWINEELNYYAWTKSNFININSEYANPALPEFSKPKNTLALDLTYRFTSNRFNAQSVVYYRLHKDFYLDNISYNLSDGSNLIIPLFAIQENLSSKIAGTRLKLDYRFSEVLSNTLTISYLEHFNESQYFKIEWNKIPNKKVSYNIAARLSDGFIMTGEMRYVSETSWNNYKNLTTQSHNKYSHTLNEKLLVDLSLQKSFWQKKVWLSILFKNLFNQEEIYHPIGVNLGLRFYLQIRLKLENLFK